MLPKKSTALIIVLYFGFVLAVLNPASAQSRQHHNPQRRRPTIGPGDGG
jgi:hypothetical protein